MRASSLFALVVAVPLAAVAAPQTETRKLSEFHKVEASSGITLVIVPGAPSATLTGEAQNVADIRTEVVDGTLKITRKKDFHWSSQSVKVTLSSPPLDALDAAGGVELTMDGSLARPKFALELSGSVDAVIKGLKVDSLDLEASGGVKAQLAGESATGKVQLSGGVNLEAKDLRFGSLSLDASGGCDAELTAKDQVTGEASGGTSVVIHGRPKARVSASVAADVRIVD